MVVFTHHWVSGFGWENTIYQPSDFVTVQHQCSIGPEAIFSATNDKGATTTLKGSIVGDTDFDEDIRFVEANYNDDDKLKDKLSRKKDVSEIIAFLGLVKIKRGNPHRNLCEYLDAKQEGARERLRQAAVAS